MHRDIDILMRMVLAGVARHRNLAFRQHEMNGDVVKLALAVAPVTRLDHDVAGGDPG